jgi:hypothetical protein
MILGCRDLKPENLPFWSSGSCKPLPYCFPELVNPGTPLNYVNLSQSSVREKVLRVHTFIQSLKQEIMPILTILIVLIIAGVILWLVNAYIPMDAKIKRIFNIVVTVFVIGFLLKVFGIIDFLSNATV